MALLYSLLVVVVMFYIGTGLEVGINDTIVANNLPTLEGDLLLTIFVAMMILMGLKAMNSLTE